MIVSLPGFIFICGRCRRCFFDAAAEEQETGGDTEKRRDDKAVGAQKEETEKGGTETAEYRNVLFDFFPLVDDDGDEQRRHGKVDAGGVEGDEGAGDAPEETAENPVALIENGNEKEVIFLGYILRGIDGTEQRIGFIGEGENHIGAELSHEFEFLQHGKAVEAMAGVEGELTKKGIEKPHPGNQHIDGDKLSHAGVDDEAHQHRPVPGVAQIDKEDAEGDAHKDIARDDGNGFGKGGGEAFADFRFHDDVSLWWYPMFQWCRFADERSIWR